MLGDFTMIVPLFSKLSFLDTYLQNLYWLHIHLVDVTKAILLGHSGTAKPFSSFLRMFDVKEKYIFHLETSSTGTLASSPSE